MNAESPREGSNHRFAVRAKELQLLAAISLSLSGRSSQVEEFSASITAVTGANSSCTVVHNISGLLKSIPYTRYIFNPCV